MKSISPVRPAQRFWLRTLPLLLLALLLGLFGLIAWAGLNGDVPRFDPAAWRAATSDEHLREQRYDVLDDLRQNYLRYDTPRSQVLEWLGEPHATSESPANMLVYELGPSDWLFLPERYFLHLYFDPQGRLRETKVLPW